MDPIDNFEIHSAKRCSDGTYVLLCRLPHNQATPWVTWHSDKIDGSSHRYWGHYCYSEDEARTDYAERTI